jgi:O-antigen ligase
MGILVGIGMIMAIIFGLFLRSVMTRELFERQLNLVCVMSLTSAVYAVIEQLTNIIFDGRRSHRVASVFSHPNYFGTIIGTVIIICAYKLLTKQENKVFYSIVAAANVVGMYLCKSMSVWMEVFLGVLVLLVVRKRYKLLALWLSAAVLGLFLIFGLKLDLIPRLSVMETTVGIREEIWRLAINKIIAEPWFGHGFMSFRFLCHAAYRGNAIPHSHNIFLDMLLNFGIVGSALFFLFIIMYYISLLKLRFQEKNVTISSLILAVTVAALFHGLTDLTLLWIQTFPLFLLILSGLGADEKNGRYHCYPDCFF